MKNKSSLVRFDWAIKRLLRQKSNFVVLEGLLSTLLGENVIIVRILESEGNKEDSEDKFQSCKFSSHLPKRPVPVLCGFQLIVLFNSIMRSRQAVVRINQLSSG